MTPTEMLRAEDRAATESQRDQSKPMALFVIRELSIPAYSNGWTLWHYKSPAVADIFSNNYFGAAADMMASGDHIHVSAPDGNAILAVESADGGVVLVRKMAG